MSIIFFIMGVIGSLFFFIMWYFPLVLLFSMLKKEGSYNLVDYFWGGQLIIYVITLPLLAFEENKNNPEILFGLLTGAILIWLSLRDNSKL